ncbi:CriSPR-associated endonuclease Cas1 [groundwater metagenome]
MQLVINTRGAYLKKEKNCFLIKNDDKSFEVSADKVDSILITTSATISTDAIEFAVENNIDIVFLDFHGNPFGRVWHSKLGSTTLIRRRQLEAEASALGFNLARGWIVQKIDNQLDFLKDLKKNRPDDKELVEPNIAKIADLRENLVGMKGSLEEKRGSIMGTEGMASLNYFNALSSIMPDAWKFNGRSRDPAQDAFNCLLNYGYGVLYSQVEKGCIIAGLDPYMGFLHTDNYNKKSFVFDLIEIFRIHIDRTVMNLFSKKQVHEGLFDKIPGGLYMNKEGKAVLITAVNETLDKDIDYNGRNVKIRNTIQMECHSIANSLIK